MRYFLLILLVLIGCSDKNQKKEKIYIEDVVKINELNNSNVVKNNIIKIKDLKFYEKNNSISYNFEKTKILVFINGDKYSNLQIKELDKTNVKYYIIDNEKLKQYFKIKEYPTILILDKNSTKKYEGFIPYEILKYELKD